MTTRLADAVLIAACLLAWPAAVPAADVARTYAVTVTTPWARATAPGQPTGAAYLTLVNGGDVADRLVGASSRAAARVELHNHEIDAAGVARMRPVPAIEVPAHGTLKLAPGGLHLMLVELAAPLQEGAVLPLTLQLEKAGSIAVDATVLGVRATGPGGAAAKPASGHSGH